MTAAKKGRVVRVVDHKTVVVPLSEETLASPDRLVAALRSFLASGVGPGLASFSRSAGQPAKPDAG